MARWEMSSEPAGAALGGRSPVLAGAFVASRDGIVNKARRMFEERSEIRGEAGRGMRAKAGREWEWECEFDEPESGAE